MPVPDWISDLPKQAISGLVSAAIPSATNPKVFQLPFINPQVPAELWVLTAVLAFIFSFFAYGLARPPPAPVGTATAPASGISILIAVSGLIVAVLALIALLAITQEIVTMDGAVKSFLIRVAYVLLFVGMGPPLGWSLGRTLG